MRFVYSFLYTCVFFLALPYFVVIGLIRGKYLSTFSERLGKIACSSERPSIWIHAVSVGELLACKSLLAKVKQEFADFPLFVSTTTITGQRLARELLPEATFYFPFDWAWAIRKVLKKIRPQLVIVMETEIWPNFLWTLKSQNIPAVLVNGRISDRSIRRYGMIKNWLPGFTENWMQTEEDARRMRHLGAHEVFVMGNLKYDFQPPQLSTDVTSLISSWKKDCVLWVAGSTMAGEEKIVLDAFARLKTEFPLKLLIAPRHPDRFSEVATLTANTGVSFVLRSNRAAANEDILILDSIGELAGVYQFADVVFVGGSLMDGGGGHNPIEPAFFGKAIVSGPNVSNLRAVFQDFQQRNAIVITSTLEATVRELLRDEEKRLRMGDSAKKIVAGNAGASAKVMSVLRRYLMEKCLA